VGGGGVPPPRPAPGLRAKVACLKKNGIKNQKWVNQEEEGIDAGGRRHRGEPASQLRGRRRIGGGGARRGGRRQGRVAALVPVPPSVAAELQVRAPFQPMLDRILKRRQY
jgi:hypothetical protein